MTTFSKEPAADETPGRRYLTAAERDARIAELEAELAYLRATPIYEEYPKTLNGVVYHSAEEEHAAAAPKKAAAVPHEDEPPPPKKGK